MGLKITYNCFVLVIYLTIISAIENVTNLSYEDELFVELNETAAAVMNDTNTYSDQSWRTVLSVGKSLDIFNMDVFADNWEQFQEALTGRCRSHIRMYIDGLRSGANWALKKWPFGEVLCKMAAYLEAVTISASVNSLVAISLDRCLTINSPIVTAVKTRKIKLWLTFVWLCPIIIMCPWLLVFAVKPIEPDSKLVVSAPAGESRKYLTYLLNVRVCNGSCFGFTQVPETKYHYLPPLEKNEAAESKIIVFIFSMDDASGRYTTGWFWGNNYWTGSQTLCRNIAPKNRKIVANTRQSAKTVDHVWVKNATEFPRKRRGARASLSTTPSPSSGAIYKPGPLDQDPNLPFPISFYVLNLKIDTVMFKSKERNIFLGMCLPRTCTDWDVKKMIEQTAAITAKAKIQVQTVRSHNQYYDLLQDSTFRVLCGTTIAVGILLILGTTYDLFLENKKSKNKKTTLNCTTYDLTNPKHVKLDMNIPELKSINGKSTMYVVNNNIPPTEEVLAETSAESDDDGNLDIHKILSDILLSFSVRINLKQICDRSVGCDTIPIVHGLRSISMAWVILGHTCIVVFKYSDNMDYRKLVEKEFSFQTVTNGAFSVDTFFFISGLLVSFLYFRTNAKGKLEALTQGSKGVTAGILHFIGLIGYRFARLTAPYLYVLGLVEICMKWFYYNSIFEPPTMDHTNCPNYWWRNILYINTLFPVDQMCMLWSWYLSDDTQFYIIGALILILATSHFKTATAILFLLMLSSLSTTGYIAYINNHMPSTDDPLALFDKIYDKPWTRLGPYLVGMSVGWLLFKTNCSIQMSKLTVLVGWLGSTAVLLSLVYGLYEANLAPIAGAAYSSLSHTAWALGLAWIVIACSTGYGGYINSILSATILYPFSRVTYCAYLIHPLVLRGMTMNMDSPLHLGKETMTIMFLGQVVASYILSFIISVAFEAPVVTMLKILTRIKVKKMH